MFTGIVQSIGKVRSLDRRGRGALLRVGADALARRAKPGDSIAVAGCCLTVKGRRGAVLDFDLGAETLACTTLGGLKPGSAVNLEPAMRASGVFGGHVVQGHVDAVAAVRGLRRAGQSVFMKIALPRSLAPCVVEKGSVTVDGVSLTVAALGRSSFTVNLIPFTLRRTTLGATRSGGRVNIETDVIGKYVARLLEEHGLPRKKRSR